MRDRFYAVATGDLVGSSEYSAQLKGDALQLIKRIFEGYGAACEIYRGDSFQALQRDPATALDMALAVRAAIGAFETDNNRLMECRLAIGVGPVEQPSDKVLEGDGAAYRLSGPFLDKMKKDERLVIATPWKDVNDEFKAECAMADALMSRWTRLQSAAISEALKGTNQTELAKKLNVSQPAVNQRLKAASWTAIEAFRKRYFQIIAKQVS